eukprot:scaffold3533_cov97-Cylindrotheca_fusiformis.AAC.4
MVEALSFLEVQDKELLEYMGMTQNIWDCWINHYVAYSWEELECYGLADAHRTLGWTETTWDSSDWTKWPASESIKWDFLSEKEQAAARQLCYFSELWDGRFLPDWSSDWQSSLSEPTVAMGRSSRESGITYSSTNEPTSEPTFLPSSSPSRDAASTTPTSLPTVSPTVDPTAKPTTSQPTTSPSPPPSKDLQSATPTLEPNIFTANESTPFPAMVSEPTEKAATVDPTTNPSDFPSSSSSIVDSGETCRSSICSFRSAENDGDLCCGLLECNSTELIYPIPYFRFAPWETSSFRPLAEQLGYTSETWSHPGENAIESKSYASIIERSDLLDRMGFTQFTWDCWMNHYTDYSWDELECYGLSSVYKELGWNESSWDSDSEDDWPIQEFTEWALLYSSEKEAAKKVCFSPEIWDSKSVSHWESTWDTYFSDSLCRSSICSTRTPENEENFCCQPSACDKMSITSPLPYFRFQTWEEVDDDIRFHAGLLGYTKSSWNIPGTDEIESLSYAYILENKGSIDAMGFTQHTWDCWMNHYSNYTWEELECYGLSDSFATLGWTSSSWQSENQDEWPIQEFTNWELLYEEEKSAAGDLCYFSELWDQEILSDWGVGWNSSFRSQVPSNMMLSTSRVEESGTNIFSRQEGEEAV